MNIEKADAIPSNQPTLEWEEIKEELHRVSRLSQRP
jgi:hypothetical protein